MAITKKKFLIKVKSQVFKNETQQIEVVDLWEGGACNKAVDEHEKQLKKKKLKGPYFSYVDTLKFKGFVTP